MLHTPTEANLLALKTPEGRILKDLYWSRDLNIPG